MKTLDLKSIHTTLKKLFKCFIYFQESVKREGTEQEGDTESEAGSRL